MAYKVVYKNYFQTIIMSWFRTKKEAEEFAKHKRKVGKFGKKGYKETIKVIYVRPKDDPINKKKRSKR